jgi:hypothetical protein
MYYKITVPSSLNLRSSDDCHKFIGEQIKLNNDNDNLVVIEFVNELGDILDYSGFLDAAVVGCTDTRVTNCAKVSKYSPVPGRATIISGPNRGEVISVV